MKLFENICSAVHEAVREFVCGGAIRPEARCTEKFKIGRCAIDYQFDKCMSDETMVKTTLRTFRMFRWLLTSSQAKKVEEWTQKELVMPMNKYLGAEGYKALEDKRSARGFTTEKSSSSKKNNLALKKR